MLSSIVLVLANCIPLYGVFFLGWDVFTILMLYWSENLVIGFYNILKMSRVSGGFFNSNTRFFIFHFGTFTLVHGMLIVMLINSDPDTGIVDLASRDWSAFIYGLLPVFATLVISHGISYYQNFIQKKEYAHITAQQLLFAPYGRVLVMHFVILIGGVLITKYRYYGFIYVLVIIKIIIDLLTSILKHASKETPSVSNKYP